MYYDFFKYILERGAYILYNKRIDQLLPEEANNINKYYNSIGWDAKYNYEYINNILNVNVNFYPLKSNVKCKNI